jgi:hypothetical protein
MQRLPRILFSSILSLFLLMGGSGLVIGKMICLETGFTFYSAGEIADCCDDEKGGASVGEKCCEISTVVIQQDDFVNEGHIILKSQPALVPALFLFAGISSAVSSSSRTELPEPVPLTGRTSQSTLRVFRI